jgi:hypothetical protein
MTNLKSEILNLQSQMTNLNLASVFFRAPARFTVSAVVKV